MFLVILGPQSHAWRGRKSNYALDLLWLKRKIRPLVILEAIHSTRNRISSLNVFQFLLYRRSSIFQDDYFLYHIWRFASELINKRKSRKRDISIIAENKPYAHHKTHLHIMKVYNTRPVSLTIKVLLRACLHGVGDPGLVGLVSFVVTLWGTQNKRNLPH